MNREQKVQLVSTLKSDFSDNTASFIVDYRGLTVTQLQKLRRELRPIGGRFKVAKVRLVKRSLEDLPGAQEMIPHIKDQIGVVFAANDSAAVAKALAEFAKQNEALQILVGCSDARLLEKQDVTFLATLPPREVLLAQLCGQLQAPMASFARVLNGPVLGFVTALQRVAEQKS